MQGENLNYAPSFGEALRGLIRAQPSTAIAGASATATQGDLSELARRANEAFERYLQLQADQRFVDAAQELQSLRDILKKMADSRSK